MKILVSNDDGVYAPGVILLANRMAEQGHSVTVVAPDAERSGAGNSLTTGRSLDIQEVSSAEYDSKVKVFKCSGTPADCVLLGLGLKAPDAEMVLAGINRGSNLGSDVYYSGTLGAAREGYMEERSSIALSLCTYTRGTNAHYETVVLVLGKILPLLRDMKGCQPYLLNVNVPDLPPQELKGFKIAPVGQKRYVDRVSICTAPHGGTSYWVGGTPLLEGEAPESDVCAVKEGYAALSFLQLDTTDHSANQWGSDVLLPKLSLW